MALRTVPRLDEELGMWTMHVLSPHPGLRPHTGPIIGYEQETPAPAHHLTPANVSLPLILALDTSHVVESPSGQTSEMGSFMAGIIEGVGRVSSPAFRGIQVDLTPLGAYRLTGGGVADLTGRVAGLEEVLGPAATELIEKVSARKSWLSRLRVLQSTLLPLIEAGPEPSPEVTRIWTILTATGGRTRISELAREVGWSPRRLRRTMQNQVGIAPKRLARLIRFEHAAAMLERSRRGDIGRIAHLAGYHDQAHLDHEFRVLAGRTPTQHIGVRGLDGAAS